MSAVFKKFVALLAAVVAVVGLAACTNSDTQQTSWAEEVAKAGFTDPVSVEMSDKKEVIMASAGSCRLRFVVDLQTSRLYVTLPNTPLGEDGSFFGDPSLALLQGDERFATCFSEEEQD